MTTKPATMPERPVPTMEFDGVTYREVADQWRGCVGCAFDAACTDGNRAAAVQAFGGNCAVRSVIYVKAMAA